MIHFYQFFSRFTQLVPYFLVPTVPFPSPFFQDFLCKVFLHFQGSKLTELKRLIDAAGGGRDLRHCVYSVITSEAGWGWGGWWISQVFGVDIVGWSIFLIFFWGLECYQLFFWGSNPFLIGFIAVFLLDKSWCLSLNFSFSIFASWFVVPCIHGILVDDISFLFILLVRYLPTLGTFLPLTWGHIQIDHFGSISHVCWCLILRVATELPGWQVRRAAVLKHFSEEAEKLQDFPLHILSDIDQTVFIGTFGAGCDDG